MTKAVVHGPGAFCLLINYSLDKFEKNFEQDNCFQIYIKPALLSNHFHRLISHMLGHARTVKCPDRDGLKGTPLFYKIL